MHSDANARQNGTALSVKMEPAKASTETLPSTDSHALSVEGQRSTKRNMPKTPKRPRDPNQLGKSIIDIATGNAHPDLQDAGKDPAAVALGRKGGQARAGSLSKKKRKEIAEKAAKARWKKK